jgi:predicted acylesterase/phospholipase RssA
MGLAGSKCMTRFFERLLRANRFEEMRIPLGVMATDLSTGKPVAFSEDGAPYSTPTAAVAPIPDCSSQSVTKDASWWMAP